jgi:hypothetical protein
MIFLNFQAWIDGDGHKIAQIFLAPPTKHWCKDSEQFGCDLTRLLSTKDDDTFVHRVLALRHVRCVNY